MTRRTEVLFLEALQKGALSIAQELIPQVKLYQLANALARTDQETIRNLFRIHNLSDEERSSLFRALTRENPDLAFWFISVYPYPLTLNDVSTLERVTDPRLIAIVLRQLNKTLFDDRRMAANRFAQPEAEQTDGECLLMLMRLTIFQ
jgi:hypothetical protein